MKLIDADKLEYMQIGTNAYVRAEDILSAKTVDAVEVVRCRDCKHHHYEKHFDKRIPYCDRINYGYGWQDNDFCSCGERKDGGDG